MKATTQDVDAVRSCNENLSVWLWIWTQNFWAVTKLPWPLMSASGWFIGNVFFTRLRFWVNNFTVTFDDLYELGTRLLTIEPYLNLEYHYSATALEPIHIGIPPLIGNSSAEVVLSDTLCHPGAVLCHIVGSFKTDRSSAGADGTVETDGLYPCDGHRWALYDNLWWESWVGNRSTPRFCWQLKMIWQHRVGQGFHMFPPKNGPVFLVSKWLTPPQKPWFRV